MKRLSDISQYDGKERRAVMKRILVKSIYAAFEYVMQHYYPAGLQEMVERSDTYAVISI